MGFLGLGVFYIVEYIIKSINKKAKKPLNEKIAKIISSAFGAAFTVIFNTILVLVMIWLLYKGQNIGGTVISFEFILSLITINFAIEVVVTTLLTPPIVYALDKYVKASTLNVVTQNDIDMEEYFANKYNEQIDNANQSVEPQTDVENKEIETKN